MLVIKVLILFKIAGNRTPGIGIFLRKGEWSFLKEIERRQWEWTHMCVFGSLTAGVSWEECSWGGREWRREEIKMVAPPLTPSLDIVLRDTHSEFTRRFMWQLFIISVKCPTAWKFKHFTKYCTWHSVMVTFQRNQCRFQEFWKLVALALLSLFLNSIEQTLMSIILCQVLCWFPWLKEINNKWMLEEWFRWMGFG